MDCTVPLYPDLYKGTVLSSHRRFLRCCCGDRKAVGQYRKHPPKSRCYTLSDSHQTPAADQNDVCPDIKRMCPASDHWILLLRTAL